MKSKILEMEITGLVAGMTMGEINSSRMTNKIFGREIKKLSDQVLEELFKWILKSSKHWTNGYVMYTVLSDSKPEATSFKE